MYRTFYKTQLLAVVLFFLSVPLTYSQQDGVIQDERPSIEYTNSLQQSADQPDLISTYDETITHSNGHTLTNGGALTLPFYEGFEASNNIPDGWTQEIVSGGLVWSVANGNPLYATLRAYAGNHNLLFQREIPYTSGLVTRLVTPELDMTGANTAVLKFYYVNPHIYNFFVYQDVLTIKYKAALENEWTTLETFSTDVTEWTEVSIVLPNLSDSYYVAFEGKCNSGIGITIDEVTINEPQTQSFVITAGAEGNGTITPSGQVIVPAGETQQFDVNADHGYHINSLLVDGEAVADAEGESQFTYTFQSVIAAHTIMANFVPDVFTVKVNVFPRDAGSVSIQGERSYGETIKLSARASGSKYVFSHWETGGKVVARENPFKFELLSDTLFEAHFRRAHGIGINDRLGSGERWSDQVRVYPNPVKDNLYVDLPADAKVFVFDIQGRLQYEASLTSGTNTINLNGFIQGTYILKLQFADEVVTKRILRN